MHAERPPDRIRICVTDTGAGLPPEQLAQLFQPFNRLGQEASAEEGTGIGLVVSKRLVELMGGVIGVESTVGVGSVFWIELNLTTAPQLAARRSRRCRSRRGRRCRLAAPLRTLLYVEDNPANLDAGRAAHRAPARPAPAERGGRQSRHRDRARLSART